MVNLKKEDLNKPIREYTPVHIREEYIPSQEYTPEHFCEEYTPNQALPVVEVVPQKRELAAPAEHNISYSQATSDCRIQYLASVFQRASETELEPFRSPSLIKKTLTRHFLAAFCAKMSVTFSSLSIIGASISLCCNQKLFSLAMIIGFLVGFFSLVPIYFSVKDDDNSSFLYETIKTATEVFISHDGANETINKIKKCRQKIEYLVYRPSFCKDYTAFKTVLMDKHDVFVLYSDKTKAAVIIDPKLFE